MEAQKLVLGPTGEPSTNQALIDTAFPRPFQNWYHKVMQGKGRLLIYHHIYQHDSKQLHISRQI